MKASSPAALFVVEAHDECMRKTDPDNHPGHACAISADVGCTFADPCTRLSSQGKADSLVVLLYKDKAKAHEY